MLAHAVLIGALLTGTEVLTVAQNTSQTSIEVLLLPRVELPRVKSLAPPPRLLNVEQLDPRAPPLLTDLNGEQATTPPGSTVVGRGAGVDWLAEARRAVRANDIRNEYSVYVSNKAAERDWWPEVHRAGERYKTAGGDWIVWINSSCYFIAGADSHDAERVESSAKVACIKQDLAKTD